MSNSKVEIKIGEIEFQLEGENKWVDTQIQNLLDRLVGNGTIMAPAPTNDKASAAIVKESVAGATEVPAKKEDGPKAVKTKAKELAKARVQADANMDHPLYQYLENKNALGNQVRRFLATASFLTAQGAKRLNTGMIAEITLDAGLAKFANASDCLNKNEKKEYCIKEGKEFTVTALGVKSLS